MRKLILEIELEYDDDVMHSNDKESQDWFYNNILLGTRGELILHSNEIGDEIGPVKVMGIIYITTHVHENTANLVSALYLTTLG